MKKLVFVSNGKVSFSKGNISAKQSSVDQTLRMS